MTHESNARMFEALQEEKRIAVEGSAALARAKGKKAQGGDAELISAWEKHKVGEMKVELQFAGEWGRPTAVRRSSGCFLSEL